MSDIVLINLNVGLLALIPFDRLRTFFTGVIVCNILEPILKGTKPFLNSFTR